jgi:hypothetical protein
MDTSEEALAAKRAEIAARVAVARAQQEKQEKQENQLNSGRSKGLSRKEMQAALEEEMFRTDGGNSGSGGKKALSRKDRAKAALEEHKMPSADQLRRQAREMSRNPELVRRANPEMRKFTDAQIRQHAKEMEKMAANPDMIQAMAKVQSMPESERAALIQLQEGILGKIPRDDKWICESIQLVKTQPDTLKKLFQGRVSADSPLSEKQLMGIVDYIVTCSDNFLKRVVHIINWGIRMSGPAGELYRAVDSATLGCAKYLVLSVMLLSLYYVVKAAWYLLTLFLGLVMGGYVRLTSGGSAAAAVPVDTVGEVMESAEEARPPESSAEEDW